MKCFVYHPGMAAAALCRSILQKQHSQLLLQHKQLMSTNEEERLWFLLLNKSQTWQYLGAAFFPQMATTLHNVPVFILGVLLWLLEQSPLK